MSTLPSTEARFDLLPDRQSAVNTMVEATRGFEQTTGVRVSVPATGDDIPDLPPNAGFRYRDQYEPFADALRKGEEVTIVIVQQAEAVIAFGFGEVPTKSGIEIMTIDVESASRRSADVKSTITITDETFEIGIGHVLVLGLIDACRASVLRTNATNPQSRYIFKSLGFTSADEDNSCLLQLEKNETARNHVS